jgi:hypothetical protein
VDFITKGDSVELEIKLEYMLFVIFSTLYRVIQEELPPLVELIFEGILSKKCCINLGPILNIYRVTFVIGNALL